MPTNLSCSVKKQLHFSRLKKTKLILIFLASPLCFFGQTLTGLWTGALSNDSSTVRKDQSFEIALTEYKGKVYGYSRSEFIVDDTLYYIVKRVKGTIEGDICEVTDDEIVSYNFRGKLDKGIKVTSVFKRNQNDSMWYLDGSWKTNATKKYYAVTGKVSLGEEKDLTASKIFPHLEELKLANEMAFYKDRKEGAPIAKLVKPEKIKTEYNTKKDLAVNDPSIANNKPVLERADSKTSLDEPVVALNKPSAELPRTSTKTVENSGVNIVPVSNNKTVALNTGYEFTEPTIQKTSTEPEKTQTKNVAGGPTNITPTNTKNTTALNSGITDNEIAAVKKPETSQTTTKSTDNKMAAVPVTDPNKSVVLNNKVEEDESWDVVKRPVVANSKTPTNSIPANTNNPAVAANKSTNSKPNTAQPSIMSNASHERKPIDAVLAKAAVVGGRKSEFAQFVDFKSDSLELALYDNGEIDGDTVSIYLNGEVIMAKQGLKQSAIKKTIYITPGNEDFTIVLFAENLGKYPPNTGLLVVHDGEDTYNLRFSSDLQKSSGIVFRRKTN